MKKNIFIVLIILGVVFSFAQQQVTEIKKTYIQDLPLIVPHDDYCGIYLDDVKYVGKIIGSEENELIRNNFSINEVLIAEFKKKKIEDGDVFEVVKPVFTREGSKVKGIIRKVGKVMVVGDERNNKKVKIVELCADLTIGSYLIPFKEYAPYRGKEPKKIGTLSDKIFKAKGKIVYIENDVNEGTEGMKVFLRSGSAVGLKRGTFIIFYQVEPSVGNRIYLGKGIIVTSNKRNAIAKILHLKNPLYKGNYWALLK